MVKRHTVETDDFQPNRKRNRDKPRKMSDRQYARMLRKLGVKS